MIRRHYSQVYWVECNVTYIMIISWKKSAWLNKYDSIHQSIYDICPPMKKCTPYNCSHSSSVMLIMSSLGTDGVGGAVRFLVVGTIGQEERPPRGQLWMEQLLVWHRSNIGPSSTQYEQIPIIPGVWPFWLTLFFFGQWNFGGLMVKLYFLCWNYSLSSGWHIIAA